MKDIPLCLSSFEAIRRNDQIYVDKTRLIYGLAKSNGRYFLSRPRRFGKSLLIFTLESLFSHGLKYFNGLWIEKHWRDRTYKVLHLDFSLVSFDSAEEFIKDAAAMCVHKAKAASLLPEDADPAQFTSLSGFIAALQANSSEPGGIVLLCDEYDAPLNANLERPEIFAAIQKELRGFYSAVTCFSNLFRFVMVTGVSRFKAEAIFGEGKSFTDLTLDPEYTTIVGFTKAELKEYFRDHLIKAAALLNNVAENAVTGDQIDEVAATLEKYYGGYCFDERASAHVLQTWAVLCFFDHKIKPQFSDHWYTSGGRSPWLSDAFKGSAGGNACLDVTVPVTLEEFNGAANLAQMRPELLLTQCGYYTIKEAGASGLTLGLPNLELRQAKARLLAAELFTAGYGRVLSNANSIMPVQDRDAQALADLFNAVLNTLNAQTSPANERQLCDLLRIYFVACGLDLTWPQEDDGGAVLTFEFDGVRLTAGFKFARQDNEASPLLEAARKQMTDKGCGDCAPPQRLRRVAMVYSAPQRQITLAEELGRCQKVPQAQS
jgi:hypothetical protein